MEKMLVDTHCHLFKEYYDNIDEIINESKENDVLKYFVAAYDNDSIKECLELNKKYEDIYICVGIHPDHYYQDTSYLEEVLKDNKDKIKAIGEIGLDYYYGKENKKEQLKLFDKQLFIAEKYNLPVVIHSREATLDTIEILKKHHVRGIMHCFSGSIETAKIYMNMGFYLGIGGVVTFKNANLKEIIKEIPLEKIVLETDSPYLSPVPFRGEKNSPKNIKLIAKFIAEIKGISEDEVAEKTTKNARDIFDF